MPRPKALLFDLDGTISETDSVHFPTWAEILGPHGYDVDWTFYQENISGRLNPDVVAEFLPQLSTEEGRRIIESKEADFRSRTHLLEPLPGLIDFLCQAGETGLKTALVTNAPRLNAMAVLHALKLEEAFDPIILAEDVGVGKPDPAPYLAALKWLDAVPEETVAFEDSPSGIKAAVAARIPAVGVASTHDPEKLRRAGAFEVVPDFTAPMVAALLGSA